MLRLKLIQYKGPLGNDMIDPVPLKQPGSVWLSKSYESKTTVDISTTNHAYGPITEKIYI